MKKRVLLFVITLFIAMPTLIMAQPKFISFGIKAGMNFSNANEFINQIKDGSITSRTDFVGGLFVEIKPLNKLSVSGELLYSGQGYKFEGQRSDGARISTDVKLGYLNVPILANYYIIGGLAVKTGVQFGMNVSKDATLTNADGTTVDLNNAFKTADLAIPVGLSYSFDWGLVIDARYNFGVTDIAAGNIIGELVIGKPKNQVFAVTLGYRF